MFQVKPFAFVLSLVLLGCPMFSDESNARQPADPMFARDCSGDKLEFGCDDCNPCTDDWTAGGECYHDARTSPLEVRNDCFPILESDPAEAGVCCAGICVPNRGGLICGDDSTD
jgi:hypothetical protein